MPPDEGGCDRVKDPLLTAPAHYRAAQQFLRQAGELVGAVRAAQHGDFVENFEAIARLWSAYLSFRKGGEGPLRPVDVAQMMVLLKIARTQSGEHNADDYRDAIGYAAIAAGCTCHVER